MGGYAKSARYRAQFPFFPEDRPLIVQLGGKDRGLACGAARFLEAAGGCDAIEINCGCPQACARKGRYGAYLMDEPDALCVMVRELRAAVSLPIFVKMRVFQEIGPTVALAKQLEAAGCAMLTVHGRTRNEAGKTGRQCRALADWSKIGAVKSALSIPVIANGNVRELADAERCLAETGCDGMMAGCGVLVDPSLFAPAEKRLGRIDAALLYCESYALQYAAHEKAIVKHLQSILGSTWLGHHPDVRTLVTKYRGEAAATAQSTVEGAAARSSLAEIVAAIRSATVADAANGGGQLVEYTRASGDGAEGEYVPSSVLALLAERSAARAAKDWGAAERILKELAALGVVTVSDTERTWRMAPVES